jgi:cytochrome c1
MTARALIGSLVLVAGCIGGGQENGYEVKTGGDPVRGRDTLAAYRCGACHTIPNVPGAHGTVGPPLTAFGRRSFIAGELPNTPRNLVRWIQSPHQVEPAVAMPTLGLDERQARDVAAFLYTLR